MLKTLRGTVFLIEVATERNQEHGEVIDYEARVVTIDDCENALEFRHFVADELEGRLEFGPIGEPWGLIKQP